MDRIGYNVIRRTYSGEDIIKALGAWGFRQVGQTGSHVKLRYIDPNTGERRTVTVPLHDELAPDTLRSIAEQAGANEYRKFLEAIDDIL